jgi:hypothetical protein
MRKSKATKGISATKRPKMHANLASYKFLSLAAKHVAKAAKSEKYTLSGVSRRALDQDDGGYAALVAAVLAAVVSVLQMIKPQEYAASGLSGTMDKDYNFSALDFPLFLNKVSNQLSAGTPPYNFSPTVAFAQANLSQTAIVLAREIDKVTTP